MNYEKIKQIFRYYRIPWPCFFLMKQLSDVELYTSEIAAKHREVTIQRQTEAAADRQY